MGLKHSTTVTDADEDEDALVIWQVPAWPRPTSGTAQVGPAMIAGQSYDTGDLVEQSYCLVLRPGELRSSYLGDFCLDVPSYGTGHPSVPSVSSSVARLFPLCWGLVLLSGDEEISDLSKYNLTVELVWEPPPPPPGRTACLSQAVKPCPWLRFRAKRPISDGQPLHCAIPRTWSRKGRGSIFEAARRAHGIDEWIHDPDTSDSDDDQWFVRHFDEKGDAPVRIVLPEDPPVVVAASDVAGVGMFATRDLYPGDFVEFAPFLPVYDKDYDSDDVVNNYTFANDFKSPGPEPPASSVLQLGGGCIYNHSEDHSITDHTYPSCPFIRKWYAVDTITRGAEVLSSYGDAYWESRGLTPGEPPSALQSRRRRCAC